MKKVAIVTFHKAHNYGAVLQAYALKEIIKNLGYDVKFFNYSPDWIIDHYLLFPKINNENIVTKVKRNLGYYLDIKRRLARHNGFEFFIRDNLNSWDKEDLDYIQNIVVGSDQIWNPKITSDFDKECFGFINVNNNAKIISYAASMESINPDLSKQFFSMLNNVNKIGVRENSLKEYIENNVSDVDVFHNLDPTLLLNAKDWKEISSKSINYKPYLLVYENYKDNNTHELAKKIASKRGLEIKILTASACWRDSKRILSDANPLDFLTLFANASFVVTTSYHGLAFAINNSVQFVYINVSNGVNNRATSLLQVLDLSSYFILADKFNEDNYENIDYIGVNNKLDVLRKESIDFLKNGLME
jgi:hypothetical protein